MVIAHRLKSVTEVFLIFLRLGFTSFGGPVAHLSYFHDEFVKRRKWFGEHAYADLVALCQFLPGPASSQVGIAVGLSRAGIPGAIAAWLGFTLPSAIALTLFALGLGAFGAELNAGWLHGLKVAAVAVVAQAVWSMSAKLCPDFSRASIAVAGAAAILLVPLPSFQLAVIAAGALLGLVFLKQERALPESPLEFSLTPRMGAACLLVFFGLLLILPALAAGSGHQALKLVDSFFRSGSLVFGGGHVVLPLLQAEVIPPGWVTRDAFLAGYGAAQAIPGPLFTFSAYLGAVSKVEPNGWAGAAICLCAAFLPSFLLVFGALPFWEKLRRNHQVRNAMLGINASVVGLLLAALYRPVWTSAILTPQDFAAAFAGFALLTFLRVPSWAVVILSALAGRFLL
ncbi:MAG: chromate efflux transporter [Bdellovibrionota bacterium]